MEGTSLFLTISQDCSLTLVRIVERIEKERPSASSEITAASRFERGSPVLGYDRDQDQAPLEKSVFQLSSWSEEESCDELGYVFL